MRDSADHPPLDVGSVRQSLLDYYDRAARELPWRGESDPYRILVSEVMLQQTRVETVKRYYGPWLERFPTSDALAAASEDEVLKAWEGLGYYRRARNLRRAAMLVRDRPDGRLPGQFEQLKALPGIGEYTAGAVASIAFGEAVPAVDGNVRRVLSRLFDRAAPTPAWLRDQAGALVDPERPGDWNQALMELGATVCTPRAPACGDCPLSESCVALAAGTVESRPARTSKGAIRSAVFLLGVFEDGELVLVVRRPADGLLAGMWAFPEVELGDDAVSVEAAVSSEDVRRSMQPRVRALGDALGLGGIDPGEEPKPLAPVEHRFSHLRATYLPYVVSAQTRSDCESHRWIDPRGPVDVSLPVGQQRVVNALLAERALRQ